MPEGTRIWLEEPNYEGVRINFEPSPHADGEADVAQGWCLLRKSLHDPLLPMNIAADVPGGAAAIEKIMREFLSAYSDLELQADS